VEFRKSSYCSGNCHANCVEVANGGIVRDDQGTILVFGSDTWNRFIASLKMPS